MKYSNNDREVTIGDRVASSEVELNDFGKAYQEKVLEIKGFLNSNQVSCIYFSEAQINSKIEIFNVSIASLKFINDKPLVKKGIEDDPFFKRHNNGS